MSDSDHCSAYRYEKRMLINFVRRRYFYMRDCVMLYSCVVDNTEKPTTCKALQLKNIWELFCYAYWQSSMIMTMRASSFLVRSIGNRYNNKLYYCSTIYTYTHMYIFPYVFWMHSQWASLALYSNTPTLYHIQRELAWHRRTVSLHRMSPGL